MAAAAILKNIKITISRQRFSRFLYFSRWRPPPCWILKILKILTVEKFKKVELHQCFKFRRNRLNCMRPRYDFFIFQECGHRHLGFWNLKFFNVRNGQDGRTASPCQISSKSFEPWPRYVSFNINIMLVWLENAYSCPFWVFWGTFLHNNVTHRPNPQKDHPLAEPRHFCHVYDGRLPSCAACYECSCLRHHESVDKRPCQTSFEGADCLPVKQRIAYMLVHLIHIRKALQYLIDCVSTVSAAGSRYIGWG